MSASMARVPLASEADAETVVLRGVGELLELTRRVEELETRNRRLEQTGACLLILAGLLLISRRIPPFDTIVANKLILRDGRGRLRVGLTPEAGLVLLDRKQRPRVELSAIGDCAVLKLYDPSRKRRVELTEMNDGAVLAISDCTQHPRVVLLGVSQDGPSLSLVDGNSVATTAAAADGPSLVLLDRRRGRGTLEVGEHGPQLVLADANASPHVVLPEPATSAHLGAEPRIAGRVIVTAATPVARTPAPTPDGARPGTRSAARARTRLTAC